MKVYRIILCSILLPFAIASCKQAPVEVSSVSLNTAAIEIVEGDTYSLVATVLPSNAEYEGINWASSNTSVASVNQGVVIALKEGNTTITASAGGKTATCSVTVSAKYIAVTSVTLDKSELSLKVGSSDVLIATVKPDDATDKSVKWSSSDASIVKVDNGKVTALKSGTAIIVATAGSCHAECVITVPVETESISLDKTELSIDVGDTAILTATITPADATDQTITWTSSNPNIVTVENGTIKALKTGATIITAESSGKKAECKVTVIVPVTGITLDKTELSIAIGETACLTATVIPDDATDKTVIWSSTDESVVKIDNGKVAAVQAGSAVVIATVSSFSASCNVTVVHPGNIICYTSSDGNIVQPYNESAFGANIISNDYTDDVGCIVFDNVIQKIGASAFRSCAKLKSINLPPSITSIGDGAFWSCYKLQVIDIPESVAIIGKCAFAYCASLKSIVFPKAITYLEEQICYKCTGLKQIEIPSNVVQINERAFQYSGIEKLILHEGLNKIGSYAFGNTGISELYLPNTVKSIGYNSFEHCAFEELLIPGNIENIGADAFLYNNCLLRVVIQEGVTYLPYEMFEHCEKLSSVSLPSTLKLIQAGVFGSCYLLSNVYLKATNPPDLQYGDLFYDDPFEGNDSFTLWVPEASEEAYKEKWAKYATNIKGYDF